VYNPAYEDNGGYYYGDYHYQQPSRGREWYDGYLPAATVADSRQDYYGDENMLDGLLGSMKESLTGIGRRVVSGFTRLTGIDPVDVMRG